MEDKHEHRGHHHDDHLLHARPAGSHNKKGHIDMTRFFESNAPTVVLLIVLVVASVLILNYAFQPTMDGIEWQEETYRVQAGDSLWAIAGSYCPDGVDRREWIDEIRALNGLPDSNINAGQKLTVLAVKEG